jgi:site-specific recombinase XerD
VKNRIDLNFRFDQPLTDLIDEYVQDFRPALLRGANTPWLFPGEAGQPKHPLLFGKQITERIQKAIGFRITPHQFRHAAAAIYLKQPPGRVRDRAPVARTSRYPNNGAVLLWA